MQQLIFPLLEASLAIVFLLPLFLLLNRVRFCSRKTTVRYLLFSCYLCGIYALVGLPNVCYFRFEPNVNLIPFAAMVSSLSGTLKNVLLFVPLGIFLPLLWKKYRKEKHLLPAAFCLSLCIELGQMFTNRATDIDDLLTNTAGAFLGYLLAKPFVRRNSSCPESDLPLLFLLCAAAMFFLQPVLWSILY